MSMSNGCPRASQPPEHESRSYLRVFRAFAGRIEHYREPQSRPSVAAIPLQENHKHTILVVLPPVPSCLGMAVFQKKREERHVSASPGTFPTARMREREGFLYVSRDSDSSDDEVVEERNFG